MGNNKHKIDPTHFNGIETISGMTNYMAKRVCDKFGIIGSFIPIFSGITNFADHLNWHLKLTERKLLVTDVNINQYNYSDEDSTVVTIKFADITDKLKSICRNDSSRYCINYLPWNVIIPTLFIKVIDRAGISFENGTGYARYFNFDFFTIEKVDTENKRFSVSFSITHKKHIKNIKDFMPAEDIRILNHKRDMLIDLFKYVLEREASNGHPCYNLFTSLHCDLNCIDPDYIYIEDKDKSSIYPDMMPTFMFENTVMWNPNGPFVKERFTVRDIKFSGDRTIVFWTDGSKTIVKMDEDEKSFDPEKAILAAHVKKLYSFKTECNAKDRSIDLLLDKYTSKYWRDNNV